MKLTVVIPVLNEARVIETCLEKLQGLRQDGHEVIVVDGGSHDETVALAQNKCDHLITTSPGRGLQLNAGAYRSTGDVVVFLHADTFLPNDIIEQLCAFYRRYDYHWGRFNVKLSGQRIVFKVIGRLINTRSALTGVASGDQAIFVKREWFFHVGCFKAIPLMEDIELCRRMKKMSKPYCVSSVVVSSSRRWEKGGIFRTIIRMWCLRLAFYCGVSPSLLANYYR